MKQNLMILATGSIASLIAVTWLLTRVSSWIVHHDEVWNQMDHEGAGFEHYIAELFHFAHLIQLPAVEAIVGSIFLVLLWRHFPTTAANK